MNPDLIGSLAATLTTAAFLPQLIKVLKHRNTEGISLIMYIIFTIGVALWLVYGLLIGSQPIIIANIVTFLMSAAILIMKIRLG
jgi:MtN3 and saliva related transmembrane protein